MYHFYGMVQPQTQMVSELEHQHLSLDRCMDAVTINCSVKIDKYYTKLIIFTKENYTEKTKPKAIGGTHPWGGYHINRGTTYQ